ncbi:MAG: hypothetical protein M3115_08110 [Thermoproteota archaeon]|nr:hypothetical protein [Thermoproteota archaeon]
MNPRSTTNNNKNGKTKPAAVSPLASALITATILVLGLTLLGNHGYHSAIAQQQQQNTTEEGGRETGSNTGITGGGDAIAQGGNASTKEGATGANLSTYELRMNLEQALTALQNNDTQTAAMYLELTLDAMGSNGDTEGNMTSSSTAARAGSNANTTVDEEDVISMGGTGAIDDYDATADD